MSGHLSGLIVRCRRLASCGRHGVVDTMRVHKPGANAKPRQCAADSVVFASRINVTDDVIVA